jgi:4-amino-4-deoxy-L-arabinose transferase-like glycosyltransferase
MADTIERTRQDISERAPVHGEQRRSPLWSRLALAGITLIAVFMDFYQLGRNGFGSYYPPAVRSMMDNWHNFFFAAYDPGAFVTIDKPPLGFWFEVASAKIFGFNTWSILVPQALAGVLSVLLLYYLVRRHFGVTAGLLAALALAVFPISVVTNRNETIDSTLALTLLIGAWAVLRAAETGKLRWLLLSALIVGLGFNIKMLEAYLVVPAYAVLYLVAAPRSIWKRIGHLALAALLLIAISLSWVVAVDLTPASQRPYVDSTQDNSELTLALGYNGLDRLLSGFGPFGGGFRGGHRGARPPANASGNTTPRFTNSGSGSGSAPSSSSRGNVTRQPQQGPGGGGPGGLFDVGSAGPLRLFELSLGSQAGWLLPLALLGMIALAMSVAARFIVLRRPVKGVDSATMNGNDQDRQSLSERSRAINHAGSATEAHPGAINHATTHNEEPFRTIQRSPEFQSLVFWGMWVLAMGAFFSVAGFFHPYYMTEMAPGIAALFGIGLVVMWRDYRRGNWRGWLLPLALIVTAAEQIYLLSFYPAWGRWMIPLIIVLGAAAVGTLVGARVVGYLRTRTAGSTEPRDRATVALVATHESMPRTHMLALALGIGVLALMIAPTVWSITPILLSRQADTLTAGPPQAGDNGGFIMNIGGRTVTGHVPANFGNNENNANANVKLISYLEANQGNTKFLVAVPSSQGITDQLIITTNKPVMSMGGFSGSDPILTVSQLVSLVKNNTVRFFLLPTRTQLPSQILDQLPQQVRNSLRNGGGFPGGFGGQSALTTWVTQHCKVVPASLWQSSTGSTRGGGFGPGGGNQQLYDCAPAQ